MRFAILSDIHGNLTALEAVCADLRHTAPDMVFHGGDLSDTGSSPAGVLDYVRASGWPGVIGNTDQMLITPSSIEEFAATSSAPGAIWHTVRDIAMATRQSLGEERLTWISHLPLTLKEESFALVHASPGSCWQTPAENASDSGLELTFGPLGKPIVVFAHVHRPSIRNLAGPLKTLVNTGSVGLSYDGDPRASYLLLDNGIPSIRRVAYDLERELKALTACGLPGAVWAARMLRTATPQMP